MHSKRHPVRGAISKAKIARNMRSKRRPVRGAISKAKIARNMRSKRHPVRGAISKAKIRWKKNSLSPNVCPNVVALSENVTSNNVAPKCGVRHKCGGASEMMEMWRQTMRRQNVASGTNVVAPPKSWKCGVKQCGVKMWRQAQMWWRLRNHGNVASNNVASKCGVRHKCGGSPKCGVKQCGVKMWRQAQMWWQSEMWRQTMRRQNVASDTPFAKLSSKKCVFKKGIQWQAQKYYTKCLCPDHWTPGF